MSKIVEMRTYDLQPGSHPEWLKVYQNTVVDLQQEILGHRYGYFYTDIGPLNQIVHMWAYDSLNDRAERRAELTSRPEWIEFTPQVRPMLKKMESKILIPAPFHPVE